MDKGIAALKNIAKCFEDCDLSIHVYEENNVECGLEIEGWTPSGVNMLHFIDFRQDGNILNPWDIEDKVDEIYNNFDIDDEIDAHREDERYKRAFAHKQSVADFEKWDSLLSSLNDAIGGVMESVNKELTEFDFEDMGISAKEIFQ